MKGLIDRIFLIVLDSFGVGELPDAALYGDAGSNTLRSVSKSRKFRAESLSSLGLFRIDGVRDWAGSFSAPNPVSCAAYARMAEKSRGKDTTTGHWEIAGLVSEKPFPVYPHGFPKEISGFLFQSHGTGRSVQPSLFGNKGNRRLRRRTLKDGETDRVYFRRQRFSGGCSRGIDFRGDVIRILPRRKENSDGRKCGRAGDRETLSRTKRTFLQNLPSA